VILKPARPILSVENHRIMRDGMVILHDVNWRVARGQHWARTAPAKPRF